MRLRQLLHLLPRRALGVEQRHGIDHSCIQAVASVLCRQNPFHACLGCGVDEGCLFAHGHEAEGEDGGVDVAESGLEEFRGRVGAFFDGDGGVRGEG